MPKLFQGWGGFRVSFRELDVVIVVTDGVNEVLWSACCFQRKGDSNFADVGFQVRLAMERVSKGSSYVATGPRDQALEVDCAGGWGRGSITYSLSGFRWCSRGHPGAVRQGHLGVKV